MDPVRDAERDEWENARRGDGAASEYREFGVLSKDCKRTGFYATRG